MAGPKRMSDRQLAANRANARRSTGPRTAAGKNAVRYNALKYGGETSIALRVFVDSTMLRCWGASQDLARARSLIERRGWPGKWLDRDDLREAKAPTGDGRYGDALFLLDEGVMFAPSFLGGAAAGMHGYDLRAASCFAGLASDRPLPATCRALSDLAPLVTKSLGLTN